MPRLRPFYAIDPNDWWLNTKVKQSKNQGKSEDTKAPEQKELVRQWVLRELIEIYQYPREWLEVRILPVDPERAKQRRNNLFGFYMLTLNEEPFFWVSVAEPGQVEQAEKAMRSVLLEEHCSGIGIATDGTEDGTRFLRRRFDSDKCDYIVDIEVYFSPRTALGSQPYVLEALDATASGKEVRTLIPLSERVENVFFDAHSHIRDIDGMHADEALDELCKVLYAKLYDEEVTALTSTKICRLQRWLYGSTEEFAATVRTVYKEANEYDTRVFSLKIPGYQRSRGVFNTPLRLSSPALAKVVETLQEYNITDSATDIKGRTFQKVIGPTIRAGLGQYFTPDPVVRFMVKVARPCVSDLILDLFCGSAHFLTTCMQFVREENQQGSEKSLHEFAFGKLHGIEKSDRMVRVAMTDMRLQGDGHSNIRCTDALLDFSNYPDLQPESFDLILTNPPFGCLLGAEAIAQLGDFFPTKGRKRVPLEALGLERCIQFLRPGGRLGIVLPDGQLANKNYKYVRSWLESQVKLRAIVSLPVETFSPFGANIKTSIIFVRKWRKGENKQSDYPIFLARADNVGYDATGRTHDGFDLDIIANDITTFLNEEGW